MIIELGSLYNRTEYDSWYHLQLKATRLAHGERGTIRLRYSIHFASDRARVLGYLKPPVHFIVPFSSQSAARCARFAYLGNHRPTRYDNKVLKTLTLGLTLALALTLTLTITPTLIRTL